MSRVPSDPNLKPPALDLQPFNLPGELRACGRRFVVWRWEFRKSQGKWTKPPLLLNGRVSYAKVNDPATWVSFDQAIAHYGAGTVDGIGVMLTGEDFFGVDLDNCRDPQTGDILSSAWEIVEAAASYVEVSPSGLGLRIILRGVIPEGLPCKHGDCEMYDRGRYLTLTGHVLDTPHAIRAMSEAEIRAFSRRIFGEPPQAPQNVTAARLHVVQPDDGELLERARHAANGAAFAALFDDGDLTAHGGDASSADLALCNHLAFWADRDPGQIDRLFRSSALMRPKWDEVHHQSGETYGRHTVALAIAGTADGYGGAGGTGTMPPRAEGSAPDTPPSGPRVYTIAEARLRSGEALEHLPVLGSNGYVVKGWTHLLAGWWRLGKTELMAAVILPWLRLGLRIVWVTEEPDSIWADRADALDEVYPPVPWEHLILVDAFSSTPAALLDCVTGMETDVVILDTIKEVCGITSMNDDADVERGVGPWLRRLRDGQRTLIALAQHRKSAGDEGARILGTVALPSKFDITLELDTVQGHERRRRLKVRRRRVATGPLVYEMDDLDRLVVIPDARSRSRVEAESAALAIVNAATEPLTTMEVRRLMDAAPDRDTVLRALTALAESARILRDPPIAEAAKRRTLRWRSATPLQTSLPQNFYPHSGEYERKISAAEDFGANAPNLAPENDPW